MKTQKKVIAVGVLVFVVLSTIVIMSVYEDTEGPLIYQIDIMPSSPAPGDVVTLAVYCIDRSGVSAAVLMFSINNGEWQSKDMIFLSCLCIAGGRWTAGFGPLAANDSARFYVTVFDASATRNSADSQIFEIHIEG